jgi:hypothetical protein
LINSVLRSCTIHWRWLAQGRIPWSSCKAKSPTRRPVRIVMRLIGYRAQLPWLRRLSKTLASCCVVGIASMIAILGRLYASAHCKKNSFWRRLWKNAGPYQFHLVGEIPHLAKKRLACCVDRFSEPCHPLLLHRFTSPFLTGVTFSHRLKPSVISILTLSHLRRYPAHFCKHTNRTSRRECYPRTRSLNIPDKNPA